MQEYELETPQRPVRIAIAAAEFNRFITDQLLEGVCSALESHGVSEEQRVLAWVPGAYELPLAADRLLEAGKADAVIALGAVIRGGTPHFDYVAGDCSRGLMDVGLRHGKAVIFGVLTTDTIEQALERAALDQGNKGHDMAMAALQMVALSDRVRDRLAEAGERGGKRP